MNITNNHKHILTNHYQEKNCRLAPIIVGKLCPVQREKHNKNSDNHIPEIKL